jgi:hypothetical protein
MTMNLAHSLIAAGILVVPSRKLYKWLTDRIGDIHRNSSTVGIGALAVQEFWPRVKVSVETKFRGLKPFFSRSA